MALHGRRDILLTLAIVTSTTGCTGFWRDTNPNPEYEECHLVRIEYERLPSDVKAEVDSALENSRYEASELQFDDAIDVTQSYVVVEETPYKPYVDTEDGVKVLELHEAEVIRAPEPRRINVENEDNREHEIHITIADGDEMILDETITLSAGERTTIDSTDKFGSYDLTARTLTGHEDETSTGFAINDAARSGLVWVTEDGIRATQAEADLDPCPWDVTFD